MISYTIWCLKWNSPTVGLLVIVIGRDHIREFWDLDAYAMLKYYNSTIPKSSGSNLTTSSNFFLIRGYILSKYKECLCNTCFETKLVLSVWHGSVQENAYRLAAVVKANAMILARTELFSLDFHFSDHSSLFWHFRSQFEKKNRRINKINNSVHTNISFQWDFPN